MNTGESEKVTHIRKRDVWCLVKNTDRQSLAFATKTLLWIGVCPLSQLALHKSLYRLHLTNIRYEYNTMSIVC